MSKVELRKIEFSDKQYFAKWWRDKELLSLTSGQMDIISDEKVDKYFKIILLNTSDIDYMIMVDDVTIGNISLAKRKNGWYETLIVIGDKQYRGKGYGPKAIKLIIDEANKYDITKIFLEVRPTNNRAIKAYEKCGFKSLGIEKYPNNKDLPETLRMELKNSI